MNAGKQLDMKGKNTDIMKDIKTAMHERQKGSYA